MSNDGVSRRPPIDLLRGAPLSFVLLKRYDPENPIHAEPILRIATKYQLDRIHDSVVSQLALDWPSTLSEWVGFETYMGSRHQGTGSNACFDQIVPEPASAIVVAKTFGISSVLPAAFYSLSRVYLQNDWDKNHRLRLVASIPGPGPHSIDKSVNTHEATARWRMLGLQDFRNLSQGRELMQQATTKILDDLEENPEACSGPCAKAIRTIRRIIRDEQTHSRDILQELNRYQRLPELESASLCENCQLGFCARVYQIRIAFWHDLPDYFNFRRR